MDRLSKDSYGNWRAHFTTKHGKWGRCTNSLNGFQALIAEAQHKKRGLKTQIRGPFKNQKFQVWAFFNMQKERIRFASASECRKNGVSPGPKNKESLITKFTSLFLGSNMRTINYKNGDMIATCWECGERPREPHWHWDSRKTKSFGWIHICPDCQAKYLEQRAAEYRAEIEAEREKK